MTLKYHTYFDNENFQGVENTKALGKAVHCVTGIISSQQLFLYGFLYIL